MRKLLLVLAAGVLLAAGPPGDAAPPHVEWARTMVKGLRRDDTGYRHQDVSVKWKGVDGAAACECHTDCSGFRIYGHKDGTVAGHAWSTQKQSEYHDQGERHLAIGRLLVPVKP